MFENLELKRTSIEAGASKATEQFLDPENSEYNHIAEATDQLVNTKRVPGAYFVASTRYVVDATLGVLAQPEVAEQLPSEVSYRAQAATQITHEVASFAAGQRAFNQAYKMREGLSLTLGERGRTVDDSTNRFLATLGAATFSDTSMVVGGAIKAMQENDVKAEAADVLENSLGLLAVALVKKTYVETVFTNLGIPYIDAKYLKVTNGDSGVVPSISFNTETLANIKQLYGIGCPANKIQQPSVKGTMLQEYWKAITRYLAPPEATIELYKPRLG